MADSHIPFALRPPFWLALASAAVISWFAPTTASAGDEAAASPQQVADRIDEFLIGHWRKHEIQPAALAGDAALLRRLTLDLAGRIPTERELDRFLDDDSSRKRRQAIERLVGGPEFPLHMGSVLDEMIQGSYAGNEAFVDYLRASLRARKSWDTLFREMMVGPWDDEATKAANRFLDKRAKNGDVLTVDATRVFFGVDISCAQCHDHPLVDDWSQDHFYGMMSFFNRTTGGKGKVGEKSKGDVTFLADGKEKVAQVMFLSGRVVEKPASGDANETSKDSKQQNERVSRRAQLVDVALEERTFFSRAIVNRLWEYFFGRGLVAPVDQMHSGNEPAVPGLLAWLADDFAASGYDLHRLVESIVSTRVYQLSSRWEHDAPLPASRHFAVAQLRPLSRRQMAASLLLATGNASLSPAGEMDRRIEKLTGVAGLSRLQQRLALEERIEELADRFDPRISEFQSSAGEALFLSNADKAQELFQARQGNLPARLAEIEDSAKLVRAAVRAVLSRPADQAEAEELTAWFEEQNGKRAEACEQLVWALVSSAEFRFNH